MSAWQMHETPIDPRLTGARALMETQRSLNYMRYSAKRGALWALYVQACASIPISDTAARDKAWRDYETEHAKAYAAYRADAQPYIDAYEAAKASLATA
jgi:hypothetical protein